MRSYKSRDIIDKNFLGESVSFVAANERVKERVRNISNEEHVLKEIIERCRHDDIFWDVGACLGIHSFIISKFIPYGKVVSFEPMPSNRGILMDNKSVNEQHNIDVSKIALSNKNEIREFSIRESVKAGFGRHSFTTGDYDDIKTIDVTTRRGSDTQHPNPNIVKIDVEGAGPLVIEGMKDILKSDECHTVIFETHEPNPVQPSHEDFGYSTSDFVDLVKDCGFKVENLVEDFHYVGHKDIGNTLSVDDKSINIVQGDISEFNVDGIVNSAGTTLRMGTGVAGSLREKGGEKLNEEAILKGPVEPGSAVRTDGHKLNASYVYHAASMPHYGQGQSTPAYIENSVRECIDLANKDNIKSIAIPMVGCGLGGIPVSTGARIIRDLIIELDTDSFDEIKIVGYTDNEFDIIKRIFN